MGRSPPSQTPPSLPLTPPVPRQTPTSLPPVRRQPWPPRRRWPVSVDANPPPAPPGEGEQRHVDPQRPPSREAGPVVHGPAGLALLRPTRRPHRLRPPREGGNRHVPRRDERVPDPLRDRRGRVPDVRTAHIPPPAVDTGGGGPCRPSAPHIVPRLPAARAIPQYPSPYLSLDPRGYEAGGMEGGVLT